MFDSITAAIPDGHAAIPRRLLNRDDIILHLDASRHETIELDSSGLVSRIKDKSTYGHDAYNSSAATRPQFLPDGLNGKGAIYFPFDVSNKRFLQVDNTSGLQIGNTNYSIFMIFRFDAFNDQGSSANALLAKGSLSANEYSVCWLSASSEIHMRLDGSGTVSLALPNYALGKTAIGYFGRSDASLETSSFRSSNSGATTTTAVNTSPLYIFRDSAATRYSEGLFGEIIITKQQLSVEQANSVLLYLSKKWGIQLI